MKAPVAARASGTTSSDTGQRGRRGVGLNAPGLGAPGGSLRTLHRPSGVEGGSRLLQRKLAVNEPGDRYEQEADRVAEQVMRADAPPLATPSTGRALFPPRPLQRRDSRQQPTLPPGVGPDIAVAGADRAAPPIVHEVLRSPGEPLDARTRAFMEPRFGRSLEAIRIHGDTKSTESATAINARAYASGSHIVFGSGQHAPQTADGQRLIAHELAHVMQQTPAGASATSSAMPGVMRQSWFSSTYDEIKEAAYKKLIDALRQQRIETVKLLRNRIPGLPVGMQSAANSIVDVIDVVLDMFVGLDLAIIGLVVGFSEGIVGLLVGIAKLVYGIIKLLVDLVLGVFDNFEHFKDDIDAIVQGFKRIPEGLKLIIGNWLERYKKASPERQALMGGELVGQVEAFIATFAFAGAKAGQVPKLTIATQFEMKMVATTTGAAVPVLTVTGTKTFGVAAPVAAAAITAPALMSAGGGDSGSAKPPEPEQGPYKDIKDGSKIEPGREFSSAQKQKIVQANRDRNAGRILSDDPSDPYQVLSDPTKSVSPGMGGQPQDPAMAAVDHIVSRAAGGTNAYGNARVISQSYNNLLRAKGLIK
jgi:hypothetical protein